MSVDTTDSVLFALVSPCGTFLLFSLRLYGSFLPRCLSEMSPPSPSSSRAPSGGALVSQSPASQKIATSSRESLLTQFLEEQKTKFRAATNEIYMLRRELEDLHEAGLLANAQRSDDLCTGSESQSNMKASSTESDQAEHIATLESEIEKAEALRQNLEERLRLNKERYEEFQRIHATVVAENAVLNKKIKNTLNSFIPTAFKMLHQGTKINKKSRDVLHSLVKIVREGLRDD